MGIDFRVDVLIEQFASVPDLLGGYWHTKLSIGELTQVLRSTSSIAL